jgi:HD-GYP domain-containing protein (c-di-GMP phosphodiesterase class II)
MKMKSGLATEALPLESLIRRSKSLNERLTTIHADLLQTFSNIDRIACALYDAKEDLLKTFISSTNHGEPLTDYRYSLSASRSLSALARSNAPRVVDDISDAFSAEADHTRWLMSQGFRSSFTVPIRNDEALYGFIFFDSRQRGAFTEDLQRQLLFHCNFIGMLISNEFVLTRTILESTRIALELTEARDFETGEHLERVAKYSELIARTIAPSHALSDEFVAMVQLFAPLHDIGKIGIPDHILLKPGRLTPDERKIMETHVERGVKIVDGTMTIAAGHEMPDAQILRNIVQCHHEFLDGTGYPQGLKGDDIPLEARIVAVADVFDALTSIRPYKTHWPNDEALEGLAGMAAQGKLDPACVSALQNNRESVEDIQRRYSEGLAADASLEK